ncbi:MAG: PolC-type DNA polymerase III [Clostridiales bacterium]|nr:PolC-type DNA polymerase III [Clostridiales bacterium]
MRRLSELVEIPEELAREVSDICVKRMVYFKEKAVLKLDLVGIDKVAASNTGVASLIRLIDLLSGCYSCRVSVHFDDASSGDLKRNLELFRVFLIREALTCMPGFDYKAFDGSELEFNIVNDKEAELIFGSLFLMYFDGEDGYYTEFTTHFKDAVTELLGYEGVSFSPKLPGHAPSDDHEPDIPFETYNESDIYTVINNSMPEALELTMEKTRKAREEKAARKAEEEKKINKDSWEYKAKEQKKLAREADKNTDFKKVRNEDAVIGRVRSGVRNVNICDIRSDDNYVNVRGRLTLNDDMKVSKSGTCVVADFTIIDKTGGIKGIGFIKPDEADRFESMFKKGGYAGFQGEITYIKNDIGIKLSGVFEAEPPEGRSDKAEMKRVELHVHSKMSEKDAVSDPEAIMKLASKFGHKACAITDHGVVQAFPEAYNAAKKLKVKGTEEPFKVILGDEGYLVEDGPTIVYGLPFEIEQRRHIGSFVSVSINTTGDDSCCDLITHIAASKYRLKGYKAIKPEMEGESDESAMEFSKKDIDKSLWNEDEIPESLRDENLPQIPSIDRNDKSHVINIDLPVTGDYSDDDNEVLPDTLCYEHVADFYAEVDDAIYPGSGEPCDSYFRMGELLEFIGDAYICGRDVFKVLAFLRRAGFGINIEDHVYYRHKFLMPAISIEDILKYKFTDRSLADIYTEPGSDIEESLIREAREGADLVCQTIDAFGTCDPTEINSSVGHYTQEGILERKGNRPYHIIFLARNNLGLYNMYHLVSESHVHYFNFRPRTPKSLLKYYSSSIIIGGACEQGEIYKHVMRTYRTNGKDAGRTKEILKSSEQFRDILSLYDYIEIQPLCNNMFLTREDVSKSDTGTEPLNADDIRIVNELLVWAADAYNMPCVATTDSHFLEPEDGMYRKYLLMDMGYSDAEMQSDLYFRTTDEMLKEFSYLGEEKAFEVVVTNTNMIADKIEYGIKPFPDGTYPPIISRAAADVRDIAYTKANRLYRYNGELNEVVKARLEKELNSIIGHGFAIMYYIAYRLVKKSNNDGYIVGSRGSVGSSFVATMCGISEVNPLPPHYRCPKCNRIEFDNSGEYGSGFDMPLKNCPDCGVEMKKDGQDIPFETFLGFNGDKEPDIDLNFSSVYQPRAHKYVEYLFGLTHTFRAGTIGTYADKNAYAVARKVGESKGVRYSDAMLAYMSEGIIGVKRTTSQHPGGIVVVPKEMDVYEFTPVQYPANKTDCGIITTHFDFHAMHDTILKLDILGHLDPTVLRMLQDLTGIDVTNIPIPDDKVMSLLESTDALGFPIEETEAGSATLGLSELGTNMARGMIKEAQPRRFYDLVQLMGLSHGTDVWTGNAQDLIREGICDLNSVIGCRDSIMTRLIYWGVPNKDAFDIMENVRKGKVAGGQVPEKWEKWKATMKEHNVPDWYIGSCEKIKYMFPKAHAAAYSVSTLRVAWFKVYYPEEYYCAFLTIRGDEFHAQYMCKGPEVLADHRRAVSEKMRIDKGNPKLKSEFYLCELVEEMYHRGIEFLPFDINESAASDFKKVAPGKIRPPINRIDKVTESAGGEDKIVRISTAQAEAIVKAREDAPFANREDLADRSGIGQSAMQILVEAGVLDDMPESSQIDMFSLLGGGF